MSCYVMLCYVIKSMKQKKSQEFLLEVVEAQELCYSPVIIIILDIVGLDQTHCTSLAVTLVSGDR